ncbi:MAG: DUF5518 domain-containing protein [Euryarchaeota archaeon]|nr:DUF5518 domain-containing protein [Euryarchaeota archaeon]MBU4607578.1 DUF5518 domain-containing protein [Euryarchaeota archaeon]MBV1728856.1 DUF5518 domain-containing protein [Methanobacterium sp.]MBV1754867.1 DUF5518 domain-containing protein [Methanobacterium sp.]
MVTNAEIRKITNQKRKVELGYLLCNQCNGYYELREGENPEEFDMCQCGGELEFIPLLEDEENLPETNHLLKDIKSSFGITKSIIIGVFVSLFFGLIYGFFFNGLVPSIMGISPLLLAGFVTSYLYYSEENDSLTYAALSGIIASLLNFFGNILIMGWGGYINFVDYYSYPELIFMPDSSFYFAGPSISSIILFTIGKIISALIIGGILGLVGGYIGILIKKNSSTKKIHKANIKEPNKESEAPIHFENSYENITAKQKWDIIWQQRLKEINKEKTFSTKNDRKLKSYNNYKEIPWDLAAGLSAIVILTFFIGFLGTILGVALYIFYKKLQ